CDASRAGLAALELFSCSARKTSSAVGVQRQLVTPCKSESTPSTRIRAKYPQARASRKVSPSRLQAKPVHSTTSVHSVNTVNASASPKVGRLNTIDLWQKGATVTPRAMTARQP